jgi:hypothetical protein
MAGSQSTEWFPFAAILCIVHAVYAEDGSVVGVQVYCVQLAAASMLRNSLQLAASHAVQ